MEIVGRYTGILERIAVKPANERQLADLRDFIEESKETVKVRPSPARYPDSPFHTCP